MKRLGNVWEKICSYDNLLLAHKMASKDKSYYKEVKMVSSNPEYYLTEIQKSLVNHTYSVSFEDYTKKYLNEHGKVRELMKLPYYPHRIIQWAIMLVIEPTFVRNFCYHSCASVPNRGFKRVHKMLTKYLKTGVKYCLQFDVKKFYNSINHEKLKILLRKKFKDRELLWILDMIVDSYPGEIGVPIGSYLSQYLANFYLSYFDHTLKEKYGVKFIIRYMDDIIILDNSKEHLHEMRKIVESLLDELELSLKSNWQVYPIKVRGIDYIGFRYFENYILLRKRTLKRLKRLYRKAYNKLINNQLLNFKEFCGLNSYKGWFLWCDSHRLHEKYIKPLIFSLVTYYDKIIYSRKKNNTKNRYSQRVMIEENYKSYRRLKIA